MIHGAWHCQFPADDLDNFFRNGGTLTLGYADIPAATGSGHGDSKGATGDDATGYTAADSTAYVAGAVIINEIMWGLDGGVLSDGLKRKTASISNCIIPARQHVTIDNKEWVISVGSLPTGYAAIDTAGNNPASGYWAAPGNGGVTAATDSIPDGHRPRVYVSCNGCSGWNCRSELGSVHASKC